MTLARSPTASRAAAKRRSFSLSLSVGDSPVVPQTTIPSEPLSTRYVASCRKLSTSTEPFALNGVTIAVRTEPSVCMCRDSTSRTVRLYLDAPPQARGHARTMAEVLERRRFRARGVVQGVGFRPFVHRLGEGATG